MSLFDHQKHIQHKWKTGTNVESLYKEKTTNAKDYNFASRAIEALTPTLMKFKQVYVADTGDVPYFVHLVLHPNFGLRCCLVLPAAGDDATVESGNESKQSIVEKFVLENDDEGIRSFVAAFLVDHKDAVCTTENKKPICLMNKNQTIKKAFTFNNLQDFARHGAHDLTIGVPA